MNTVFEASYTELKRLEDENERLRLALDIARKALLRVERLSEEGRAALSKVSNVI